MRCNKVTQGTETLGGVGVGQDAGDDLRAKMAWGIEQRIDLTCDDFGGLVALGECAAHQNGLVRHASAFILLERFGKDQRLHAGFAVIQHQHGPCFF